MHTDKRIIVDTKNRKEALGDLFGIFFEDLNHGADGGLYAELVQNRSFEFDPIDHPSYNGLTAWEKVEVGNGQVKIQVLDKDSLNDQNLHYVEIDVVEAGDGVGIKNLGFNTGIPFKKDENYLFSFYAKSNSKKIVKVSFEGKDGELYGEEEICITSSTWKKYETTIMSNTEDYSGRLVITTKEKGKLYLDMISLFPEDTYKNRKNGMRKDIALLLEEMKPKFMRFPGGCLVHDGALDDEARNAMYRWKKTIGAIEQRPPRRNNWGYNQTLGLGYYEYFILSEDLGAKPIPVLPGGYNPHQKTMVPIEELKPWIDDALDLIEFANGDVNTKWGQVRADLGHPEPFNLEYIAIGNEEVGEPFFERYPYFHQAIKEKYPEIKIINSSGPFAAGSEYERGWKSAKENKSDLVDEHYYQSTEWFIANYHRYDDFKKEDPKVFLGEYASWGNTYYNALVEAAFMTGLEKNAHAVGLACYAPMLCNVDYVNWRPDMIWFNNHEVYATANYYVQKLFMIHQGDDLLAIETTGLDVVKQETTEPITGKLSIRSDYADGILSDIKLVNHETKEEITFKDVIVDKYTNVPLGETNWENYTLSLKVKRTSENTKGFHIYFGEKDDKNRFRWEFGGWQNQDSLINAIVNGRGSVLTQSIFSIETNREYQLDLVVKGRNISTYIDGILFNETEDKLPVVEPLYYSASIDHHTNDIIVKVINIQDVSVCTELILDGIENKKLSGKIYQLSGYKLTDENSFDEPEHIKPKEKAFNTDGNAFIYEFPKHSVTIFRLNTSK